MKLCKKCNKTKDEIAFAVRKVMPDGSRILQSSCRSCQSIASKAHYQANKQDYIKRARAADVVNFSKIKSVIASHLETHHCVDCGESDPIVLEFDHVRGTKMFDISNFRKTGSSIQRLLEEIAKCEVRCANCHRRVTHLRRITPSWPNG